MHEAADLIESLQESIQELADVTETMQRALR